MLRFRVFRQPLLQAAVVAALAAGWAHGQSAAPTLTSVSPTSVAAGSTSVTITLTGTNLSGANVLTGTPATGSVPPVSVQSVSSTQLVVQLADSLVANPGTVSITAVVSSAFSNTLTLTVTSGGGSSGSGSGTGTSSGGLTITTSSLPQGAVGVAYSQQLAASGGTPPYKWSFSSISGSVDGLSLNSSGLLSGTPVTAQTLSLTIQVIDSSPTVLSASATFNLTITAGPLGISTTSLGGGITGVYYYQTVNVTGGLAPYTFSVTSGTLPAGLTLAPSTGVISGTPTTAGSSNFTISVSDSETPVVTVKQALSIAVAALTPVVLTSQTLAGGTVNTPYSQVLQASGGAQPYIWTVVAGTVPPGLLLSTAGTLSGVPTTAAPWVFTVQLTDQSGATARAGVSVTIAPATLQFTAPVLPSGMVNVPYPVQILNASGGTPPYTFSVPSSGSGAVPAGMTFANGQLSGTPTSAGTFNMNVTATDSSQPPVSVTVPVQIVIRAAGTDLMANPGSLSFSLDTGASAAPGPQSLTITSTASSTPVNYSVAVTPSVSWLAVTGAPSSAAATPGSINVVLTAQALSLAAQSAPYTTSIVVSCVAPSPCAGNSYKVPVNLTVSSPAPQLVIPNPLVSLAASNGTTTATGTFGVQNAGGGTITVNSVTAAASWLTVTNAPTTLAPGPATYVTVTANASGFQPGLYQSSITVATSAGSAIVPVTLVYTSGKVMTLNPLGQEFRMAASGALGNSSGSFEVLVDTAATVNWTAAVAPGANWLALKTTSGTSTAAAPGTVGFSINTTAAAALSAGAYYGQIQVSSTQESNTPQTFLVVLYVTAASTPSDPDPEPGGLLFIPGATGAPPQTLTLYASSTTGVPYQAAAETDNGGSWLTVSPLAGTVSSSTPVQASVTVSTSGLAAGTYTGRITYAFSPASLRSVNVTLIVPGSTTIHVGPFSKATPEASSQAAPQATTACTSSSLTLAPSGPAGNFSAPASWPVELIVAMFDNCGNAVSNGNVTMTFNNGDAPIALTQNPTSPGTYNGTWTPRGTSSQLTATAFGTAPGLSQASVTIPGQVQTNPANAPVLVTGGTLNAFNPAIGGGIAPGTAVSIYGSNFAPPGSIFTPSALPFPTSAGGTSVYIGGQQAPLYYVGPGQINAQVPFELTPGTPYQIFVATSSGISTTDRIQVTPGAPGMAAYLSGGVIAQHAADYSLVTESSPAKPGEALIIYLTGLGNTANDPADGAGAAAPPTSTAPDNPVTLSLNGVAVPNLLFVGLTPASVGLYQIDFTVPTGTPDGDQQLTITQAGAAGNTTVLPVHH